MFIKLMILIIIMIKINSKLKKVSALVIPSLLLFAGCSTAQTQPVNENPTIITTFYPIEEITKFVTQDTVNVKLLIPKGAEPHSFEPTTKQIVEISKADVFITMEGMFETIENKIIDTNKNIKIIESTHDIELIKLTENDEHSKEEHLEEETEEYNNEELEEGHDDHRDFDPHVWLSIQNMKIMTEEITEQLIELYPQNKELYNTNKQKYLNKLENLENKFQTQLSTCSKNVILVNHKSFGYLAHEYGFEQISASGFNPESEPSPKTIQDIINQAKEHNLSVIYSEGQMDKKVANLLATEINGQVLELNPILTTETDYFELMENNLKKLKIGLDCK
jgi:zinc transport system substrate-binding protein